MGIYSMKQGKGGYIGSNNLWLRMKLSVSDVRDQDCLIAPERFDTLESLRA